MHQQLYEAMGACPVIAAIKEEDALRQVLPLDNTVVFVLGGDILSIGRILDQLRDAGKIAMVHVDLIQGLSAKEVAVDFLKERGAHGIISTKPALIRHGKELDLYTILRLFVFDSLSLRNVEKSIQSCRPDLLEILPGVMPKVVAQLTRSQNTPLICGGLIMDKQDVLDALKAGAMAISTTNPKLWSI